MEAWWQRWGRGALTLTRTQRQFKRNPRARKRRSGPLLDFCVETLERLKRQQITFVSEQRHHLLVSGGGGVGDRVMMVDGKAVCVL